MAISKIKPRHASEGRSIAAVLKDRLDYDKNPEKTKGACWYPPISAAQIPRGRNLPSVSRFMKPLPGGGAIQTKMLFPIC